MTAAGADDRDPAHGAAMAASSHVTECWVVSDGRAGVENQALGLAEAVARIIPLKITPKRISVKSPWKSLPRGVWGDPFRRLSPAGALLRPPYPKLWIACGRLSIPFSIALGEIDPSVFRVQIQDPRAPARRFSLVVPPSHDGVEGPNVFPIIGAPGRATRDVIDRDTELLAPALAELPHPRVLMLIGGPNRAFRMDDRAIMKIARIARSLARADISVLASASRRTPPEATRMLRRALARFPSFIWDGAPFAGLQNPYFGLLGVADHVMVTEDSVNMATEAAATAKPVHIIPLPRRLFGDAGKFDRFHSELAATGASRRFTGTFEAWNYKAVDETARAAGEIVRRLNRHEIPARETVAATG